MSRKIVTALPFNHVKSSPMIDVLFEDNHVIFVNKPAGVLTQPTEHSDTSLEEQVKEWLKEKYQKPGDVYLHAIHRLDRCASGIVLFAKTSKALSRLNESLRAHEIKKEYLALSEGTFQQKKGEMVHFLTHGEHKALIDPKGKKSHLFFDVLKENNDLTLLHVVLTTGRYHQIRAQLSASHHPIVGDDKYHSTKKFLPNAICLHHWKMSVPHPTKKEIITIVAKAPSAWPLNL